MAGSLRDQLIKSGLVTADQARKAERQARVDKNAKRQTKSKASPEEAAARAAAESIKARARALHAEKAARDRARQQELNEKAAAKALRAELKQLIQQNDQRTKVASDDDVPYNFLHGKRVKRIYITREQQAALSTGSLVIVNDDGRYHLVTSAIAERVRGRDPKRIIAAHGADQTHAGTPADAAPEPGSDDEYYARFKVPDDLDW